MTIPMGASGLYIVTSQIYKPSRCEAREYFIQNAKDGEERKKGSKIWPAL
jgi:hypothetical protein